MEQHLVLVLALLLFFQVLQTLEMWRLVLVDHFLTPVARLPRLATTPVYTATLAGIFSFLTTDAVTRGAV